MRKLAAAAYLALSTVGGGAVATAAHAQGPEFTMHHGVEGTLLSVTGQADAKARPDMATIDIGVTTEAQTAQAALAENSRRMQSVMAALRRVGVAERDIQTSQLSVNPQQIYEEGKAPRITGYQAYNTVTAKIRDIAKVGRVVDAAVGDGGNQVNGVSFGLVDPDTVMNDARKEALKRARARAELYAQAAGMRVHRILQIQEGGSYNPPMPLPVMAMSRAMAESTPVSPGEVELSATVNVMFELR